MLCFVFIFVYLFFLSTWFGMQPIRFSTNNVCWASSACRDCVLGWDQNIFFFFIHLSRCVKNGYPDLFCKRGVSSLNKLWHLFRFGTSRSACLSKRIFVKRWLLSTNKQIYIYFQGGGRKKKNRKMFAAELVLHPGPVRDANDAPLRHQVPELTENNENPLNLL